MRFILALLLIVSIGCSRKEVTKKEHDQAISETKRVRPGDGQKLSVSDSDTFSKEKLKNKEIYSSAKFLRKAGELFSRMLQSGEENETERLYQLISSDCNPRESSCHYISVFSNVRFFGEVMEKILSQKLNSNSVEDFFLLRAVLEMENYQTNLGLDRLFLLNVEKHIEKSGEDINALISEVMSRYARLAKEEDLQALIGELDPFKYLASKRVEGHQKILLDASIETVFIQNGGLEKSALRVLRKQQEQERSFHSRLKKIEQEQPLLIKGLDLKNVNQETPLFWMVDLLFYDRASFQTIEKMWTALGEQKKRIGETVYRYLRIQIAYQINETNKEIRKYVTESKVSRQEFFSDLVRKGSEFAESWLAMSDSIHRVLELKKLTDLRDSTDRDIEKPLDFFLDNTRFFLAYPQQLLIFYLVSKANFEVVVKVREKEVTVNSAVLFREIFNGKRSHSPLFLDYGSRSDEKSAFDYFQLVFAFELALRTRAFDAFNVHPAELMQEIFDKLVTPNKKTMLERAALYLKPGTQGAHFESFKNLCSIAKAYADGGGLPEKWEPIRPSIKDLMVSPVRSDLAGRLYYSRDEASLNVMRSENSETLEGVQRVLFRDVRAIKNMMNVYTRYLDRTGEKLSAEKKSLLKKLDSDIEIARSEMRDLIDNFRSSMDFYHKCVHAIVRFEDDLVKKVFAKEVEYIRKIHDAMKAASGDSADLGSVLMEYEGFPNGYRKFDKLSKNEWVMYQMDYLARHAKFAAEIHPAIQPVLPTQLEDNDQFRFIFWDELTTVTAGYEDNFDSFLSKAFNVPNGWLDWYGGEVLQKAAHHMKLGYNALTLLSRMPRESCEVECQKGDPTSILSLIELVKNHVKMTQLDEQDYKMLELMGKDAKFSFTRPGHFEHLFYEYSTNLPTGLFDYPYFTLTHKNLGDAFAPPDLPVDDGRDDFDPESLNPQLYDDLFEEITSFTNSSKESVLSRLIFPVGKDHVTYWRENLTSRLEHRLESIRLFQSEVQRVECNDKALDDHDPEKLVYYHKKTPIGKPRYLRGDRYPEQFGRFLYTFDRQTEGAYRKFLDPVLSPEPVPSCDRL